MNVSPPSTICSQRSTAIAYLLIVATLFTPLSLIAADHPAPIQSILRERCITCHSTEKQEGELDLEQSDIALHPQVWEHVLEQIGLGEMPPKKAPKLSDSEKRNLTTYIRKRLDEIALASSGDPGPVVLRRLSNHEYTYTIADLTDVATLDPLREFPVDGAAGEGFTNVGSALVMSPSLLTKYLDAAKAIASHAVLLPDGFRFSPSTSQQDWTDETLASIQTIYARYGEAGTATQTTQQGIRLDIGTGTGRLPIARYLAALQGKDNDVGLSQKYLTLLREALQSKQPSPLLDPLREKFRRKELTAEDIEVWQAVLWRFATVGHIGKVNGPKAWQEPMTPITSQHEMRVKLSGERDNSLYLVVSDAGDGTEGDQAVWSNARIIAKGRPDIAIGDLPALTKHLHAQQQEVTQSVTSALAAVAEFSTSDKLDELAAKHGVRREIVEAWLAYLQRGESQVGPLLTGKLEKVGDYVFVKAWTAENDLSVIANASDTEVRIPGTMRPHSIATHPAPTRASVIAWKSSGSTSVRISASLQDSHLACGNGVSWSLEVRRGTLRETLSAGNTDGGKLHELGPFDEVKVDAGDLIALVIGPRDGEHTCDLTTINLTIRDTTSTWDLSSDVAPSLLKSNPHGPWHFASEPTISNNALAIPEGSLLAKWMAAKSTDEQVAIAKQLQSFLQSWKLQSKENPSADESLARQMFSAKSPFLSLAWKNFVPSATSSDVEAEAPSTVELTIPAAIAMDAEFVVTGRLKEGSEGTIQMQVMTAKSDAPQGLLAGSSQSALAGGLWSDNNLRTQYTVPVIAREGTPARERLEKSLDEFRQLFPIALCYSRIVPVDEVVTLTLYYREDDHLRRLMLTDTETAELDRLWRELLFISEAPRKQVDAFEQLYQFATQDASPEAFEPLRAPILAAAEVFEQQQPVAHQKQIEAVIQFAAKAWRRPLTTHEVDELRSLDLPIRLRIARVLTSPAFLYRAEQQSEQTGPVSDHQLATRLSYFLWSSMPDETLRQLADRGELHQPAILQAQVRRMLQDPKIERLSTEFGCQWLHVRDVALLDEKSERHFPTFTAARGAMQEEVARFFTDMLQHDRSIMSLLEADHTFVNRSLAEHYGLTIKGDDWQRIEGVRQQGRGGILGFAATLAKHSGASRTSPILRGTWLSEVLLGEKLPNPPQGVPVLPEETPEGLTERQLTERHSSDENCAGCHRRVDPFGFALEGYDAIGRSRTKDAAGLLIDTKTTLPDGTQVEGLDGLRNWLSTTKREVFIRQYCRKLLGYALGRSVQLSDKPLIDAMLSDLTASDYRASIAIEKIVLSPQFREIRGKQSASALGPP